MHTLVRTVFSRLHSLDPAIEEAKLNANADDAPEGEIKLNVLVTAAPTEPVNPEAEKLSDVDSPLGNVSVISQPEADSLPDKPTSMGSKPECE